MLAANKMDSCDIQSGNCKFLCIKAAAFVKYEFEKLEIERNLKN